MSGVFKGIKKAFRKVARVAKKVLPAALAIGAVVFTVGGAMGVPAMAGGWGGAVSRLTDSLGATGMLGNVLTGALTQAGYGAVLGAGTSLLTGGDISKGAGIGALGGAATGGLMGGLDMPTDPLAGIGEGAAAAPAASGTAASTRMDLPPSGLDGSAIEAGVREGAWGVPQTIGGGAGASTGGGLAPGGWLERNQTLAGHGISGLGQGLMGMAQGDDSKEAAELALKRDREERAAIAANYGSGDVSGYRSAAAPSGMPTPVQRFDPVSYRGSYVYDPAQGRVVFVPENA